MRFIRSLFFLESHACLSPEGNLSLDCHFFLFLFFSRTIKKKKIKKEKTIRHKSHESFSLDKLWLEGVLRTCVKDLPTAFGQQLIQIPEPESSVHQTGVF
jgi:hypothetical protein